MFIQTSVVKKTRVCVPELYTKYSYDNRYMLFICSHRSEYTGAVPDKYHICPVGEHPIHLPCPLEHVLTYHVKTRLNRNRVTHSPTHPLTHSPTYPHTHTSYIHIASFPGLPTIQFLIAYGMQKWRGRPGKFSHV